MKVPLEYGNNFNAHFVCKLKKALFILKQSPQAWFSRFVRVMIVMGYQQSQRDLHYLLNKLL